MKKISLVDLSRLEVKPEEAKIGDIRFYFLNNNYLVANVAEDKYIQEYIGLNEFDKPLIEIEEEPLLTDEEREFLKMCIKFSKVDIKYIRMHIEQDYVLMGDNENLFEDTTVYFKDEYFKGLEVDKTYTLEELGLE